MATCLRCAFAIALIAVSGCKAKGPIANATQQDHPNAGWSSDGINVAAFLVSDDFYGLVDHQETALKKADLPLVAHVDIVTTAKDYEEDFEANEVAADEKYHSKKVLLYGTVRSINKDAMGDGYFTLASRTLFGVQAHLNDDGLLRAASTKKGDNVALVCDPGMRIIGVAAARNCSYVSQYLRRSHFSPEEQVRAFFAGKVGLPKDEAAIAALGYVMGTSSLFNRDCVKSPNMTTCDPLKWKLSAVEKQQLNGYIDSHTRLLQDSFRFVSCNDFSHKIPKDDAAFPSACVMLAAPTS